MMKPPRLVLLTFSFCALTPTPFLSGRLYAEDQGVKTDAPPAEPEPPLPVPAAVLRAAVRSEEVMTGAAAGKSGGEVIIQWIEKPVPTAAELAEQAAALAPLPEPAVAQNAARRKALEAAMAKAPAQTFLFTPGVTGFPGNISLVEWSTSDAAGGYTEAAAWVKGPDLAGTVEAVGDLEVKLGDTGKTRRYLMAPSLARVSGRFARKLQPPSPEEFGETAPGTAAVLMERGDSTDGRTMEPLTALLSAYADPVRAAKITADAAALKAAQAAAAEAAAWAAAHPQPPEPQIVRFYTSDADEIPTLEKAATARRAAETARPAAPAFPDITPPGSSAK